MRPAVVRSRAQHVELVAAHRPDLACPKLAGARVPCEIRHVAMTVGVDLRVRVIVADERVVRGDSAVVPQAHHLADVAVELLRKNSHARVVGRKVRIVVVEREIDRAVRPECGAARYGSAHDPTVGDKNFPHVGEGRVLQASPRKRGSGHAVTALYVVEIDEAILGKLWMDEHRLQARRLQTGRRPTADGRTGKLAAAHDPHAVRKLGDQQSAVGQKRDVPRIREAFRHGLEPDTHQIAGRTLALRLPVRRAELRQVGVEDERTGGAGGGAARGGRTRLGLLSSRR